jgi:glycosyltransferase involved in cell wall biosynthesis
VRILWRSDLGSPLAVSGYAGQTALFVPRIASLGHEIVISAPGSYRGQPLAYGDHLIIGGARDLTGNDVLAGDYQRIKPDLLLTLCDLFALYPSASDIARMNAAHWMPVDTEPAGEIDIAVLRDGGGTPVAISRFGQRMLEAEGCSPLFIPHGIETSLFTPGEPNEGPFTIGINAANKDLSARKRIPNQMLAFARFRERHPEARLKIHSAEQASPGLNLRALATRLGIAGAVSFPDMYSYATGIISADAMAAWYRDLDILSNCANEGFGLPVLEAQASGVPVVVSDCSAGPELCGAGWKIPGELEWTDGHNAWWFWPYPKAIEAAYEDAWQAREDGKMPALRAKATAFAGQYDADRVLAEHWVPALEHLKANLR